MTQKELANALGMVKSSISMYENGHHEPDFNTLGQIASFFGVHVGSLISASPDDAIESILGDVGTLTYILHRIETDDRIPESFKAEFRDIIPDNPLRSIASIQHSASMLSSADRRFLAAYRKASPSDRQIIDNIVARYPVEEIDTAPTSKIIPLFGTAAAAGPGEFDTGLPFEEYSVPADSGAAFAVRISGDSMEPVLQDGQIALCAEKAPQIGDVTVMMVNGALLVKQFSSDSYGNIYLRSLNRARRDLDLDVMASGNDTVTCYGTVILKRRPDLVDQ